MTISHRSRPSVITSPDDDAAAKPTSADLPCFLASVAAAIASAANAMTFVNTNDHLTNSACPNDNTHAMAG